MTVLNIVNCVKILDHVNRRYDISAVYCNIFATAGKQKQAILKFTHMESMREKLLQDTSAFQGIILAASTPPTGCAERGTN